MMLVTGRQTQGSESFFLTHFAASFPEFIPTAQKSKVDSRTTRFSYGKTSVLRGEYPMTGAVDPFSFRTWSASQFPGPPTPDPSPTPKFHTSRKFIQAYGVPVSV